MNEAEREVEAEAIAKGIAEAVPKEWLERMARQMVEEALSDINNRQRDYTVTEMVQELVRARCKVLLGEHYKDKIEKLAQDAVSRVLR